MPNADPGSSWRGPGRRCGANKPTAGEWSTPTIAIAPHTRRRCTAGSDCHYARQRCRIDLDQEEYYGGWEPARFRTGLDLPLTYGDRDPEVTITTERRSDRAGRRSRLADHSRKVLAPEG